MKLQTKVASVFDAIVNSLAVVGAIFLAYLIAAVTLSIILREFGAAIDWLFETTEYSLLWITFLGAAWVLREDGHVKMDLLVSRLSSRNQFILDIITSIIGALICFALTWAGAKVSWDTFQSGYFLHSILAPPIYPIIVIIPIGSFLLFIQFIRRTNSHIKNWRWLQDQK